MSWSWIHLEMLPHGILPGLCEAFILPTRKMWFWHSDFPTGLRIWCGTSNNVMLLDGVQVRESGLSGVAKVEPGGYISPMAEWWFSDSVMQNWPSWPPSDLYSSKRSQFRSHGPHMLCAVGGFAPMCLRQMEISLKGHFFPLLCVESWLLLWVYPVLA